MIFPASTSWVRATTAQAGKPPKKTVKRPPYSHKSTIERQVTARNTKDTLAPR